MRFRPVQGFGERRLRQRRLPPPPCLYLLKFSEGLYKSVAMDELIEVLGFPKAFDKPVKDSTRTKCWPIFAISVTNAHNVELGKMFVFVAAEGFIGQPVKSKRPKEPGENKIKPVNKKVKPRTPKMKERESADSSLKSQSILTQVMDKGRFQKPAATLSLSAGESIELRCKGSNVTWNYPSYLDTFKDTRLSIKQLDRYGQLILANSTAADTGEYSCWLQMCSGNKCRKDETKTGSTYIFFTDKEELFVPTPSYFEIVYLNPDKPAVIPCRVTTPSAKVTLHREFPAEEIEIDGTDIIYDVKKGFVYQHPTSDHKGIVYCKAESQGAPQISIKYHLLYVEVPKGPPSTTIAAEVSDSVRVICTVLGEPDVDVTFRWQYPGQESERPVIIQNFWRLINRGTGHTTRISKSVLVVEDFEARDAGNYICIAQNLQGETTVATKVELN
ncbi:PREDICTED: platelet-derived growth factor receptor-like protein [Leptosomus discolor]|uniref:platelet-derived growth factor receptor-like protein n=1 Tax=Leptosomus discolor TaxID=188344 RepID=UPI0005226912|nr:PREDICTED: platelet-derived growth factor receptor-like protein [Leptosomus discolor]